jgi:hypothetical protein
MKIEILFGAKRLKLYNEIFYNSDFSENTNRIIGSRRIKREVYEDYITCSFLFVHSERKKQLGLLRYRQEYNIRMDLSGMF